MKAVAEVSVWVRARRPRNSQSGRIGPYGLGAVHDRRGPAGGLFPASLGIFSSSGRLLRRERFPAAVDRQQIGGQLAGHGQRRAVARAAQ